MKQKRKYEVKKLNKKTKKNIFLLIIFILLIIIFDCVLDYLEKKDDVVVTSQYSNIQEILEKYGCTYIKETKSKDDNFYKDIYLNFKFDTFEENKSQQRYYTNLIGDVGILLENNFRLIDESRKLNIEVYKNEDLYAYVINGDNDYFTNMESKKTLENYSKDEETQININSQIVLDLINNNWDYKNISFGEKETIFNDYEVYFDEGIEVRKISKKVYNITYNTKYNASVVNNIIPGTKLEEIISKLGTPTYGTSNSKVIGYKGKEIYVFFSEDEISIYRNEKTDTKDFEDILQKYANKQMNLKEFINELTYVWDDYSQYIYNESFIKLVYPLKGIQIYMQGDSSKNIEVYNNYSNIESIKKLIEEEKIKGKLDQNLLYLSEQDRVGKKNELLYLCQLQGEKNNIKSQSNLFAFYINKNNINIISKENNNPNITVQEDVNTAFWYTDTSLIYSIKGKGIYLYDLNKYTKTTLLEGKEDYTFENYENNILTYDKTKKITIMD